MIRKEIKNVVRNMSNPIGVIEVDQSVWMKLTDSREFINNDGLKIRAGFCAIMFGIVLKFLWMRVIISIIADARKDGLCKYYVKVDLDYDES